MRRRRLCSPARLAWRVDSQHRRSISLLAAPEVFLNQEYGTAVDWWSFGAVLYELLTGLPPWYSQNPHTMRKRILNKPLTFPNHVAHDARDLLRQLLQRDPKRRLGSRDGSAEIKCHAFFRSVDWQRLALREIAPPIEPCSSLQSIVRCVALCSGHLVSWSVLLQQHELSSDGSVTDCHAMSCHVVS